MKRNLIFSLMIVAATAMASEAPQRGGPGGGGGGARPAPARPAPAPSRGTGIHVPAAGGGGGMGQHPQDGSEHQGRPQAPAQPPRQEPPRQEPPRQEPPRQGPPESGKPGEGRPGQGQPGEGRPGQGQPGDGRPGQGQPGEGRPGEGPTAGHPDRGPRPVFKDPRTPDQIRGDAWTHRIGPHQPHGIIFSRGGVDHFPGWRDGYWHEYDRTDWWAFEPRYGWCGLPRGDYYVSGITCQAVYNNPTNPADPMNGDLFTADSSYTDYGCSNWGPVTANETLENALDQCESAAIAAGIADTESVCAPVNQASDLDGCFVSYAITND